MPCPMGAWVQRTNYCADLPSPRSAMRSLVSRSTLSGGLGRCLSSSSLRWCGHRAALPRCATPACRLTRPTLQRCNVTVRAAVDDEDGKGKSQDSSNMTRGFGKSSRGARIGRDMSQQDALIQSLSAVGRMEGRTSQGRNVVLGGEAKTAEEAVDKWKELDQRLGTEYPCMRNFKAIGHAGEDYASMVRETVSQGIGYAVPDIMVVTRASKNGTYWTVDVGPVEVKTQEQVIQIYAALRADPRTKFMI